MAPRVFEGIAEMRQPECNMCGNDDMAAYFLLQEELGLFSSDLDWLGWLAGHRVRITVEDLGEPEKASEE